MPLDFINKWGEKTECEGFFFLFRIRTAGKLQNVEVKKTMLFFNIFLGEDLGGEFINRQTGFILSVVILLLQ